MSDLRACICFLTDMNLDQVGTLNTTGAHYKGHYSIWLTNDLQEMLAYCERLFDCPRAITGWLNGNLYLPTKEVGGVLPIPDEVQLLSGMSTFIPSVHSKQPHSYLARLQGTRLPVLPIHNPEERSLFRSLMAGNTAFNTHKSGPKWDDAVRVWNAQAEQHKDISYKVHCFGGITSISDLNVPAGRAAEAILQW